MIIKRMIRVYSGTQWQISVDGRAFEDCRPPQMQGITYLFEISLGTATLFCGADQMYRGEIEGHRLLAREIAVWREEEETVEIEGDYDPWMGLAICRECGEYILDGYCGCVEDT